MVFFSPTECNCYPEELKNDYIAAGSWPDDATLLTDDEIEIFFCVTPPSGKKLGSYEGRPAWVDKPSLTIEQLSDDVRLKRNKLISETDYLVMPDYPISSDGLTYIKAYRQALRDIPTQPGYPTEIDWPPMPE